MALCRPRDRYPPGPRLKPRLIALQKLKSICQKEKIAGRNVNGKERTRPPRQTLEFEAMGFTASPSNCLSEIARVKSRLQMIQKNASLLRTVVVLCSEGKHRSLLYAGIWLLAVGFVLMFRKILGGK